MSKYFIREFAVNGDKVIIPDNIQPSGEVSYQIGFGLDYQRKLGSDPLAKPFPRQGFNGLVADITGAIKQYQEQGFYDFITPEMNEGQPFAYSMGACIRYDMSDAQDGSDIRNFSSLINNNTGNPKDNPDDWSDLSDSNIEFATNEETQEGIITDKAVSPASMASVTSSNTRRGLIQIATNEEVANGVNTTKSVVPSTFLAAFSKNSKTTNGYQVFPGGLIIQWGITDVISTDQSVTITFPIAFETACLCVVAQTYNVPPTGGSSSQMATRSYQKESFIMSNDNVPGAASWVAFGF